MNLEIFLSYFSAYFLAFFVTSASGLADENPCLSPEVRIIEAMPNRFQAGETFRYRYYFHPPASILDPTIMIIPGGPGQAFIDRPYLIELFPKNFGLILIDPRGIGCNVLRGDIDPHFFTSEFHAEDLAEVAIDAKVADHLIVYGISYGTVPATLLAKILSLSGHPPLATVLEGVIGNSAWWNGHIEERHKAAMDLLLGLMTNELAKKFIESRGQSGLPDGIIPSPGIDRNFILNSAKAARFFGESMAHAMIAKAIDKIFSKNISASEFQEYEKFVRDIDDQQHQKHNGEFEFANPIYCEFGLFYDGNEKVCQELRVKLYDSKEHQILSPIYYFQGEMDQNVDLASARYHYDNQSSHGAKKYFIQFPRVGHNPLHFQIAKEWGCNDEIWKAITNTEDPTMALQKCGKDFQLFQK